MPLDLEVLHLAGGGAAGLDVVVRATVNRHYDDDRSDPAPAQPETRVVRATLDDLGKARVEIPDLPRLPDGGTMVAEMGTTATTTARSGRHRIGSTSGLRRFVSRSSPESPNGPSLPPARISAYDVNGSPVPGIAIEAEFDTVATLRHGSPYGCPAGSEPARHARPGKHKAAVPRLPMSTARCRVRCHRTSKRPSCAQRHGMNWGTPARASRWIRPTPDPFLDLVGRRPDRARRHRAGAGHGAFGGRHRIGLRPTRRRARCVRHARAGTAIRG